MPKSIFSSKSEPSVHVASTAPTAPAVVVPAGAAVVVVAPAPEPTPEPTPAPKVDPLPDAVRALLAAVPRDIAGLPGTTPQSYARYLTARDVVEAILAAR